MHSDGAAERVCRECGITHIEPGMEIDGDINAIGNGSGWMSVGDWGGMLVPWLLQECEPKANGCWHLTHAVEIAGPA